MKEKELRAIKAGLLAQGEQREQEEVALDACIAAKRKRAAQPPQVRGAAAGFSCCGSASYILQWNIPADMDRRCTVSVTALFQQVLAALAICRMRRHVSVHVAACCWPLLHRTRHLL